jgi:hypothetical protein
MNGDRGAVAMLGIVAIQPMGWHCLAADMLSKHKWEN